VYHVDFFAIRKKLLSWLGIEPKVSDLSSQSGAYNHLAMAMGGWGGGELDTLAATNTTSASISF